MTEIDLENEANDVLSSSSVGPISCPSPSAFKSVKWEFELFTKNKTGLLWLNNCTIMVKGDIRGKRMKKNRRCGLFRLYGTFCLSHSA